MRKKHSGESFESMMRRFKRTCEKSNTILEFKKREQYNKPSVARKLAKEIAVIREKKRQEDMKPKLLHRHR